MNTPIRRTQSNHLAAAVIAVLVILGVAHTQPAYALTDFMYFSVNGDTTATSVTQGDTLTFNANCGVGATVRWEVWYDANGNSTVDQGSDVVLGVLSLTDGDPNTDADGTKDGWVHSPELTMFVHAGSYIFMGTDVTDLTSVQQSISCSAMSSPPNQITGTITVPGISPPNSAVLKDVLIWADLEDGDLEVFTGITDQFGDYEINVPGNLTGFTFEVSPTEISNFASSQAQFPVVTGVTANIDFAYAVSADSVYGYLKDGVGDTIQLVGSVNAEETFGGSFFKERRTQFGRYAIHFSAAQLGEWTLEVDREFFHPLYLTPDRLDFSHDTLNSFQHDFTLYEADAVIYARITENGGPSTNSVIVVGSSAALSVATQAVSDVSAGNIATLRVTSADASGWSVSIESGNQDNPLPPGFIWDGIAPSGVSPGDTVTLNLIAGHTVTGQMVQDPGDAPVSWENVWVSMYSSPSLNFVGSVDGGGFYSVTCDTGSYSLSAWLNGYLVDPPQRSLQVTPDSIYQTEGDTTGGFGFTMNRAHCQVTGTLVNVPTNQITSGAYYVTASTDTWPDGYQTGALVDSATGSFQLDLCDGNWTIQPPHGFAGFDAPPASLVSIGEDPDCPGTVDLVYTPSGCPIVLTGDVNQSGAISPPDIIYLVNNVFKAGAAPLPCLAAGDVNCSGNVSSSDIVLLVNNVFKAGPPPCDVCTMIPGVWSCP